MPLLPLLALSLPILLLAAGLWWRAHRRARAAEDALAGSLALVRGQSRRLGVLAGDLSRPGLSLLGLADRLAALPGGPPLAEALRVEARDLLATGDTLSDEIAAATGPRHLREEPMPLSDLLDGALGAVRAPLSEGGRHWHADPGLSEVTVLGDRRALTRALSALLARAVRETRQGDAIAVRAVRSSDRIALVVEDEGPGRPAGDLANPLAAPQAVTGTRGLAPGLATARDLVRAHGGELSLESAAGIGSRAWLSLPRQRVLRDG